MPSRRAVLSCLGVLTVPLAGCSSQPTGQTTTTTKTTPPTATETPTSTTADEAACAGTWDPKQQWATNDQTSIGSIAATENAVFGFSHTAILEFSLSSGDEIWRTPLDDIDGLDDPLNLVASGTHLAVIGVRHLAVLDTSNGTVRGTVSIPGKPRTADIVSTAVTGDVLYVSALNSDSPQVEAENPYSRIYAIDLTEGTKTTFLELSTQRNPVIPRNLVTTGDHVIVDLADRLLAYNLDGTKNWAVDVEPSWTPEVAAGKIFVPTTDSLIAFDVSNGRQQWQDSNVGGYVTVDAGVAYTYAGASATGPQERGKGADRLVALRQGDGSRIWEEPIKGDGERPNVNEPAVFLPIERDEAADLLTGVDRESGCRLGSVEVDSLSEVATTPSYVFVVDGVTDGTLEAYEVPHDGD